MKARKYSAMLLALMASFLEVFISGVAMGQEIRRAFTAYEDYAVEMLNQDDDYLASLEEWQNMISQWLENPLSINNEEADGLMEYKIISLYQLNKLKEYRFKYGSLLSLYELNFIDGWDFQTVRKVIPLVTSVVPSNSRIFDSFTYNSFKHNLVVKTAINTQKSKGYKNKISQDESTVDREYKGNPLRLAIRYDIEFRKKIAMGLRAEKDPGEQMLIPSTSKIIKIKAPDLTSGYLHLKDFGLLKSLVLGNYRVSFGYGVNLSVGQSAIKSRSGISGMSDRVRPQTSVSETGYLQGMSFLLRSGRFSLSGFASLQKVDGTSIVFDSISGKALSFSSIDKSGLHRTESELEQRRAIPLKTIGGFVVYQNNWLKTGFITLYNKFNASITKSERPNAKFELSGKENLVSGISATIWLPGIQFFTEASFSKNKGMAVVSGLQLVPAPGASIVIIHRFFAVNYQNWNGSGFISASRNSNEKGAQLALRYELPRKWLIEITADHSRSDWVSYELASPDNKIEIKFVTEKSWLHTRSLVFSFRYHRESIKSPEKSTWISHPIDFSQYKLRLEGRIEAMSGVRLKSRLELNFSSINRTGWLLLQDIEFTAARLQTKFWFRVCLFEAMDYENRIYAYENDVLYDFTSFLHYGKGLRGIMMIKLNPLEWLDIWIRLSTVYYTNKLVGSGWDQVDGSRQNEIEVQLRIRLAH